MKTEFDSKAKNWDTPQKIERAEKIAGIMQNEIPLQEFPKAFEYGCGTGLLSFALQNHFDHLTLADVSEGMLNTLKSKIKKLKKEQKMTPLQLDLTREPAPQEAFDLAYTLMTLHHICDIPHIIQQFHKLLRPKGYLCIADLDKEDGSFHGKEVTHVHRGFNRKELKNLIQEAGFYNIKFCTAYQLEHKNNNGVKGVYPIFLMTAQKR